MNLLRRLIALPLVIFAVPVAGFLAAGLLAGRGDTVRVFIFSLDGRKWAESLSILASASAILGVLLIAIVYLGAAICRDDRRRLASVFAPLVRCVSLGVAALALLQMSVAALSTAAFLLIALHFLPIGIMVALALGGFYTARELTRTALSMSEPAEMTVLGLAAARESQPSLWRMLDAVGATLQARPPDHLILGLMPGFFATGSKVHLPDKVVLVGETIYLSITTMRLLSQQELSAVIGHELSHFTGEDTGFTLRFVPTYQRLQDALTVSHAVRGYSSVSAQPARIILREALLSFATAERGIRRAREIAADQAGARASTPHALIGALLRTDISQRLWPALIQETVLAINSGEMPPNMGDRLEQLAVGEQPVRGEAAPAASPVPAHPSDTHPTLAARAGALGIDLAGILPLPGRGDSPASTLVDRQLDVETGLLGLLCDALITSGAAKPPRDPSRPSYLPKQRQKRVEQAEARKRRMQAASATDTL